MSLRQLIGHALHRYSSNTDLASRVGNLNPKWNEDNTEDTLYTQFLKAVALTGSEFQVCKGC